MEIKYEMSLTGVVIKHSSKEKKRGKTRRIGGKKDKTFGCFPPSRGLDPPLLFKWCYDLKDEWGSNLSPQGRIDPRWRGPAGKIYDAENDPGLVGAARKKKKKRKTHFPWPKSTHFIRVARTVHKESLIEVRNKDYCHKGCISTKDLIFFLILKLNRYLIFWIFSIIFQN